jgi:hypothetical protein
MFEVTITSPEVLLLLSPPLLSSPQALNNNVEPNKAATVNSE